MSSFFSNSCTAGISLLLASTASDAKVIPSSQICALMICRGLPTFFIPVVERIVFPSEEMVVWLRSYSLTRSPSAHWWIWLTFLKPHRLPRATMLIASAILQKYPLHSSVVSTSSKKSVNVVLSMSSFYHICVFENWFPWLSCFFIFTSLFSSRYNYLIYNSYFLLFSICNTIYKEFIIIKNYSCHIIPPFQ